MSQNYHWSSTQRKWILIQDMNDIHLMNAIKSKMKSYNIDEITLLSILELKKDKNLSFLLEEYLLRLLNLLKENV